MDKAKALVDEQKFSSALEILNAELSKSPKNVEALLLRSTVYTRKSKLVPALIDAERAVVYSDGSPESQLRRAVCLFRLKRLDEAHALVQYFPKGQEADTWKQIIKHGAGSKMASVPKIPVLSSSPEQPPVKQSSAATAVPSGAPRVDWYQTATTVTLTLYRKGLDPAATKIAIEPHSVSVNSGEFHWSKEFENEVSTAGSSYDLTPFKVEFVLKKASNTTWSSLDASSTPPNLAKPAQSSKTASKAASTSAATGLAYNKWEHLGDDDDDEEKNDDPMEFFKKLYKDASPETQKAMMKSYIESNGTTLSTNWEEVSKGKVETHPPRDTQAKKWD